MCFLSAHSTAEMLQKNAVDIRVEPGNNIRPHKQERNRYDFVCLFLSFFLCSGLTSLSTIFSSPEPKANKVPMVRRLSVYVRCPHI